MTVARLISTVYVKDPETFQWVTCEAGTEPEPRLAALILTPSAWEDGQPPEPAPDAAPAPDPEPGSQEPADPKPESKPRARRPSTKADD